jgi:hypoxanthine phosphoribosyltransferase
VTEPSAVTIIHSGGEIQAAAARIGAEMSAAYPGGVVLVGVLTGSVLFLADLIRSLTVPCEVDFLGISAYSEGSGRVRMVKDLDSDILGKDVVLVEDIVDTGLTCTYLLGELGRRGPGSVEVCALFDRRSRRIVPVPIRFSGFEASDDHLLGYGLDVQGRYRNLPFVAIGDTAALQRDPDSYVQSLYGR